MKAWTMNGLVTVLCIIVSLSILCSAGCLTPAQRADLANYEKALAADKAEFEAALAEIAKYKTEIAAIRAKVQAGEMPKEEGLALVEKFLANIDSAMARRDGATKAIEATKAAIDRLKESNSPWWVYVLGALPVVFSLGAQFVPALSPIAAAARAANAALSSTSGELAATREMAGSLSRTLDAVGNDSEALAIIKQDLMRKEQSTDELATKADYDRFRAEARAGLV